MRTEVEDATGIRGEVTGMSTDERELVVTLHNNIKINVPLSRLNMTDPHLFRFDSNFQDLKNSGDSESQAQADTIVIPVTEEFPVVRKQFVDSAKLKIKKTVNSRVEMIKEDLNQERVEVERIKIDKILNQPAGVRTEGDVIIVPVQEEVLVVEKRILLKEEIHIRRHFQKETQTYQVELRREEVTVEKKDLTHDIKENKT